MIMSIVAFAGVVAGTLLSRPIIKRWRIKWALKDKAETEKLLSDAITRLAVIEATLALPNMQRVRILHSQTKRLIRVCEVEIKKIDEELARLRR